MAEATYSVMVAWDSEPSDAFTIGTSTLGGGDVLVGMFSDGGFTGPDDDITADVRSFKTDRGRDGRMDLMRAGTCSLTLSDPDGRYNPSNPGSPLAGQLRPMRPVRVQATLGGDTYTLFYGFIRSVEADPVTYTTQIAAVDLFVWLARVSPVIAAGAVTTGAAIGRVLDAAGWTSPLMRDLDTGDTVPAFTADGSKTALAIIGELLEAERGTFYISAAGVATYRDRHARDLTASSASFAGSMVEIHPGIDLDGIRNRATVERTGGTPQVFSDPDSIAAYGLADEGAITTPYLVDDNQALSLASFIVASLRTPAGPAGGMTLYNDDATRFTQMLTRDVGDRVTVTEPRAGTSGDYFIEKVEHEVGPGGKLHRCTWGLSERTPFGNPFILGSSTLGGGDVLTY